MRPRIDCPRRVASRCRHAAFTLVELLVVIAIIGVLVAILLPAIQAVRESSRRTQCYNNLKQLAVAALDFEGAKRQFPPGVQQSLFIIAPVYRGTSLFVHMLPQLEENALRDQWDFNDPINNTIGGLKSRTAIVLPVLLCPSDLIDQNPILFQGWNYALTSYGGNGGSRSFEPAAATADGVFHTTGPAAEPSANQRGVRLRDITDGTSKTLLFGERNHDDPNYETFSAMSWGQSLKTWGWWGASGGQKAVGHVTMSACSPINYRIPFSFANAASASPPADSGTAFQYYVDLRMCAFGSSHPSGASFALADGSVRFLDEGMTPAVLQALATRAGGESIAPRKY